MVKELHSVLLLIIRPIRMLDKVGLVALFAQGFSYWSKIVGLDAYVRLLPFGPKRLEISRVQASAFSPVVARSKVGIAIGVDKQGIELTHAESRFL